MQGKSEDYVGHRATPALWQALLRMRWLLGAAIAIAFALGQFVEAVVWGGAGSEVHLLADVLGWGLLGGLAVWSSLTWVSRQERRYQAAVEQAARAQQALNQQLQQANRNLALLSEVNRTIADSATLDAMLDAAVRFPQQLLPVRAATLVLFDGQAAVEARVSGASAEELARLRKQHAVILPHTLERTPTLIAQNGYLALPLDDDQTPIGVIELFLADAQVVDQGTLELLQTIAGELAEGLVSTRRRVREAQALYELEQAIAEERARIARDIHDGIAQTLAFRRMRIDLWLDWIDTDPERLRSELIENKQILRDQIAELRWAIWALRPVQFDELGFIGGLHRYIVEWGSQYGLDTEIDLGNVPSKLPSKLEALCFRVVQEALTNVVKHARASKVMVCIEQIDEGIQIVIRDDGVGFAPDQVEGRGGSQVGLRQMRERVQAARGQLTILSQGGAGTELRAWVPTPKDV